MKTGYLRFNSRVIHLGDGAIYGISANIVAVEMEYLVPSEGLRDVCRMGSCQVDRAAIPGLASTHAADDGHALVGIVDVLGKRLGAIR